jgi:hypothetical protein
VNSIYKFDNLTGNNPLTPVLGDDGQFAYQRGLRIGTLDINKLGIEIDNGTTTSIALNSSGLHTYNNSDVELITVDSATGLNITDGTNNVFKALISGTNIGDVTIGNYPTAGAFYDKSAATFAVNGAITATSGTIGGWTLGATTLTGTSVILNSAGEIMAGDVHDNVSLKISTTPVVSFMISDAVKGLLRATTVGSGGISAAGGDFVLDNSKSLLIKGTGASYGGIGVPVNDTWVFSTDSNYIYFKNNSSATMGLFAMDGVVPYFYTPGKIQLLEISEPGNPGTGNTDFLFLKDNGAGKTQLCVRFRTGVTQVIETEP